MQCPHDPPFPFRPRPCLHRDPVFDTGRQHLVIARETGVRALASVGLVLLAACSDPAHPQAGPLDTILVGGGESTSVAVLSVESGAVFARPGPVPTFKDAYALSSSNNRLYLTARDNSSPAALLAIDTHSLTIALHELLSAMSARNTTGAALTLSGSYALAVSPDGTQLVMDALSGGSQGLAFIDVATLTPTAFLGPLYVSPGCIVPWSSQGGAARYLVVGARTPYFQAPRADYLYVIGGQPLAVLDSFQLTPPRTDGSLGLLQAIPSIDDSTVFVVTSDSLVRFETTSRRAQASAPRPSSGWLVLSPDESQLYLTDPGSAFDSPGSGLVYVFGSSLNKLTSIDLKSPSNGVPVSNYAAFTKDSRFLLVSSGTSSRGPLFGSQPGRLFVIDRATNQVANVVSTGDWLARQVFVF